MSRLPTLETSASLFGGSYMPHGQQFERAALPCSIVVVRFTRTNWVASKPFDGGSAMKELFSTQLWAQVPLSPSPGFVHDGLAPWNEISASLPC
jgi:hypothetical protein